MNKTLIAVGVIVLVLAAFFLLKGWQPSSKNTTTAPLNTGASAPKTSETPREQTPQPSTGGNVQTENTIVEYSEDGFSPVTLHVKVGTTVTFKNVCKNVMDKMWVASNPHPLHTDYPGFDAGKAYGIGESYSFTFMKQGSWGYHNHLEPERTGIIIVE
jgi:plastocyanin